MKVFNVFNVQRITEYNETFRIGGAVAPEVNPNFRNVVNYQTPRSVLFSARYEF